MSTENPTVGSGPQFTSTPRSDSGSVVIHDNPSPDVPDAVIHPDDVLSQTTLYGSTAGGSLYSRRTTLGSSSLAAPSRRMHPVREDGLRDSRNP